MSAVQEQARALGDPTRHAIFRNIAEAGGPVGVAELTEQLGLNHNAIRQHLAKLGPPVSSSRGGRRCRGAADPGWRTRWISPPRAAGG